MTFADFKTKNLVPLLVVLVIAYVAGIAFRHESLSIVASIMLSGCLAIFGSVYLARGFRKKGIGNVNVLVVINFVLTTVLVYFLLRAVADLVVPAL